MGLNLSIGPEGISFAVLVEAVADIDQATFQQMFSNPFLVQLPELGRTSQATIPEAVPADRQTARLARDPLENEEVMSTVNTSLEDLLAGKWKKRAGRFVHVLSNDQTEFVIGRSAQKAQLVLGEGTVSSRHARLFKADGAWKIEDLGSSNGTFLDGMRLQPNDPQPVQAKQNLWFSSYRTMFLDPAQVFELAKRSHT